MRSPSIFAVKTLMKSQTSLVPSLVNGSRIGSWPHVWKPLGPRTSSMLWLELSALATTSMTLSRRNPAREARLSSHLYLRCLLHFRQYNHTKSMEESPRLRCHHTWARDPHNSLSNHLERLKANTLSLLCGTGILLFSRPPLLPSLQRLALQSEMPRACHIHTRTKHPG